MTEPHAVAYAALRARVAGVVQAADAAALDRTAPATPAWRTRDVLAHLVGVADDATNGRLEGAASDAWTAAQVDKRREMSAADMLREWEELGPAVDGLLAAAPAELAGQAVFDAFTHEHDIRHALGQPGVRDTDAMELGWSWIVDARTRSGVPAIRFVTEAGEAVGGVGEPQLAVRASRFELMRATSGRRTVAEIGSYGWEPGPDVPALIAAPFFSVRADSLGE